MPAPGIERISGYCQCSHIAVGGDTNRGGTPWPVSPPATFHYVKPLRHQSRRKELVNVSTNQPLNQSTIQPTNQPPTAFIIKSTMGVGSGRLCGWCLKPGLCMTVISPCSAFIFFSNRLVLSAGGTASSSSAQRIKTG